MWKLDLETGKGRYSRARMGTNAVPQTKTAVALDKLVVGTEKSKSLTAMSEEKLTELDSGLGMDDGEGIAMTTCTSHWSQHPG